MKEDISIIGSGTMGTGIAQVAAANGLNVNLIDISSDRLEISKSNLSSVMNRLVEKQKISLNDSNLLRLAVNKYPKDTPYPKEIIICNAKADLVKLRKPNITKRNKRTG